MAQWSVHLKAKAKLNLYLHVGKLKSNNRHDLTSCVVFCSDVYDEISISPAPAGSDTLTLSGAYAATLAAEPSNLILQATARIRTQIALPPLKFDVNKAIPVQAGLGGGSADAGAIYRWAIEGFGLDPAWAQQDAAALGGDVPVCVRSSAHIMAGEGERLTQMTLDTPLFALLVNPNVVCPTGQIFAAHDAAGAGRTDLPEPTALGDISRAKNDLQPFAITYASKIKASLDLLAADKNILFARLSGSGATCFAVFTSRAFAEAAKSQYRSVHSDDWCRVTVLE